MLTLGGAGGGPDALHIGASGQEDPPTADQQPGTLSKCAHARPARTSIVRVVPDARPPPRLRVLPGTVDLDRATCEARALRSGRSGPGCAAARLPVGGLERQMHQRRGRPWTGARRALSAAICLSVPVYPLSVYPISSIQYPEDARRSAARGGVLAFAKHSGRGGGAAGCSMHSAGVRPECGADGTKERALVARRGHTFLDRDHKGREKRREFNGEGAALGPRGRRQTRRCTRVYRQRRLDGRRRNWDGEWAAAGEWPAERRADAGARGSVGSVGS